MKLIEAIMTNNPCYTQGRKITVKGLMLHSVGCAQPSASVFINNWNKASFGSACVHGFIDGNDGTVYQTLPWDHRGWHAGGAANNTHIGVEMCEPDCIKYVGGATFTITNKSKAQQVAKRTYQSAVELFAMLCDRFDLDPTADGVIVSHSEGLKRGIASNHADPEHLWRQLGLSYTMDTFRADVKKKLGKTTTVEIPEVSDAMTEEEMFKFFRSQGLNDLGAAGLMGNLQAESGLVSTNLQNTYNKKLNITDEEYTRLVDGGNYPQFTADKAGYGLAQWTYWSRKAALLSYAQDRGTSIGNAQMQCEFLMYELKKNYPTVLAVLQDAKSVAEASNAVLLWYERPANTGESVQKKRAALGQAIYVKYAGKAPANTAPTTSFLVKVGISNLNIRKGPGTNHALTGKCTGIGTFTIVETANGVGSDSGWGRLKSGAGWVSLDFCEKV